jgi:hypothetical protein
MWNKDYSFDTNIRRQTEGTTVTQHSINMYTAVQEQTLTKLGC